MIKELIIKNFQSHELTELNLSPSVNMIVGNSDSGKSSIVRAIEWLRTNKPKGTAFIKNNASYVTVTINTDKDVIKRRKDINNAGYYAVNKKKFSVMGNDIPLDVERALNLNDINIQTQLDNHFLILLPSGQVAQYLNSITKLDRLTNAISKIRELRRTNQNEINSKSEELENIKTFLNSGIIERIANCKEKLIEIDKLTIKISQLRKDINYIKERLSKIYEIEQLTLPKEKIHYLNVIIGNADELHKVIIRDKSKLKELKDIVIRIKNTKDDLSIVTEKIAFLKEDINELNEQLTICPYCEQELTQDAKKTLIKNTR